MLSQTNQTFFVMHWREGFQLPGLFFRSKMICLVTVMGIVFTDIQDKSRTSDKGVPDCAA